MAKQTGAVRLTGKLGRTIFYNYRGKPCSRMLPDHVRQSAGTRSSAMEFGVISKRAKFIRRSIVPYLDIRYDGTLVNRVNRALITGPQLPEGHPLQGFRFNPHTGLDDMLVHPPVLKAGVLQLPAQPIRKTGNATHLEIRAIGVRINFADRSTTMNESSAIIDLQQAFNGLQLPLEVPGKGMLFIILQLKAGMQHKDKFLPMGDRRYMAADIVTIIPPAASNPLGLQPAKWKRTEPLRSNFSKHVNTAENQYVDRFILEQIFNDEKLTARTRLLPVGEQALQPPIANQLE